MALLTRSAGKYLAIYSGLALFAILTPLFLHWGNLRFVASTYGRTYEVFEFFGFCASISLIAMIWIERKRTQPVSLSDWLPILLTAFIGFQWLMILSEYSLISWDYQCYELAAKNFLAGSDPYNKSCYLYPPLLAQVMGGLGYLFSQVGVWSGGNLSTADAAWSLVFYFFQTMQLLLILIAYRLSYAMTRVVGLEKTYALVFLTVLFTLNNPLLRTIRFNQVSLWILVPILAAILYSSRRPGVTGFLVALGVHIKLYPVLLLIPLLVWRKWRAIIVFAASFVGVLWLQIWLGHGVRYWQWFLASLPKFAFVNKFRDNSLTSVVYNSLSQLGLGDLGGEPYHALMVRGISTALSLAFLAYFVIRFLQRERSVKYSLKQGHVDPKLIAEFGLWMDVVAAMLIISPMVWEHHYVIAMPIAIWAVAIHTRLKNQKYLIWAGIATFLIFGLPTFDVFPFSYHRLLGLIFLIWLTDMRFLTPWQQDTKAQIALFKS